MKWMKVVSKGVFGFVYGVVAAAASNPDAVVTLAGAEDAVIVGAVVSLLSSLVNFLKHKDKV